MSRALFVEPLETRLTPAVTAALDASGLLVVTGSDGPDEIRVRQVGISPAGEGSVIFVEFAQIRVNGRLQTFVPAAAVTGLIVSGRGGSDTIDLASGVTQTYPAEQEFAFGAVIDAGGGADFVLGTSRNDVILGGAGADQLRGLGGDDNIRGGDGNDDISGGDGSDRLFGDAGNDDISGGRGVDLLSGGAGADVLSGSLADVFVSDRRDFVYTDEPF